MAVNWNAFMQSHGVGCEIAIRAIALGIIVASIARIWDTVRVRPLVEISG
jgi:hypothetical protein